MGDPSSDRNILFGALALQDDLIDKNQLADLAAGGALRPENTLAELLVKRGLITTDERDQVDRRLERKLSRHGGDTHATLQALADDLRLRDAIQTVSHHQVHDALASTTAPDAVPAQPHAPAALPPGSRSRYALARVYAEGGLGRVWLAHDSDLNRDVALKEIKGDRAENSDTRSRFLKEAQITGQLEHPNIVPVYELGRRPEDNQPFYTMRFVRGRTLREVILDYHKRRAQGHHDPLEFQRLLGALVAVCQAIGYAHSRGVIHRDLKPENIVLGSFGEVIVLDWGLAKLVGGPEEVARKASASAAAAGQVTLSADASTEQTVGLIGTPAYMAPEQADARHDLVNERTDIYGLGAILFEILTGRTPVEAGSVTELLSKLSSGATRRARTVVASVPAPLDAICARAMAADPNARYARATDLADDIQRWIADEPVAVYHDPWTTRLVRWGRRHRTAVTTAAALGVATVIGLVIYNVQIGRARAVAVANAREATRQKGIADQERGRAEANFARARDAVDQMLTEVGAVELADVPQVEPVRERLLAKAQRFYLDFLEQAGSDPSLRADAGRGFCRLGDIEELLGDFLKAENAYRQSLAMLGTAPSARADRARAEHGLGILLKKANRFREAEDALRAALRLRTTLAQERKDDPEAAQALAQTRYHLGALVARLHGRRGEEEESYRAALKAQNLLVADSRGHPARRRELARYLNNLGILLRDTGRTDDAEQAYSEALAIAAKLGQVPHAPPGDRWQWAQVSNNLGVLLKDADRPDEAEAAYLKARELQQELAAAFPRIPAYRAGLAATENNLGLLWMSTGDTAAAQRALGNALDLLHALLGEFPHVPDYRVRLAETRLNLGTMLEKRDPDRAETQLRAAQTEGENLTTAFPGVPEYDFALGNALYCLGDLRARRDDLTESRRLLNQAIQHQRAALDSDSRSVTYRRALCLCYRDLAVVLKRQSDHAALSLAAQELPRLAPDDPDCYRYAALDLAQAAVLAARDTALSDPRQAVDGYARAAVALLRKAFTRRLIFDPRELAHPGFDPLRQRNDFQELLDAMNRRMPPRSVVS